MASADIKDYKVGDIFYHPLSTELIRITRLNKNVCYFMNLDTGGDYGQCFEPAYQGFAKGLIKTFRLHRIFWGFT